MAARSRHASEETATLPPEEPEEPAAPPVAVYVLLAINFVVFVAGLFKSGVVFDALAIAPRSMRLYQLFSFGFLHFGLAHFAITAFVLALFGPKLERRLGAARTLGVYLGSGLAAAMALLVFTISEPNPKAVAAGSAAVAGLLGAFCYLFPQPEIQRWRALAPLTYLLSERYIPARPLLWMALFVAVGCGFAATDFYADFGWMTAWIHVFGFLGGLGLAVASVRLEPDEVAGPDGAVSPRARREIEREVMEFEARRQKKARGPVPVKTFSLGLNSRAINEILKLIEHDEAAAAYARFVDVADGNPDACLAGDDQWSLAQALIESQWRDAAIDSLKRLLRHFPHGPDSKLARYELGLLYAEDTLTHPMAMDYLRASLEGDTLPPEENAMDGPKLLSREARRRANEALETLALAAAGEVSSSEDSHPPARFGAAHSYSKADLKSVFGTERAPAQRARPDADSHGEEERGETETRATEPTREASHSLQVDDPSEADEKPGLSTWIRSGTEPAAAPGAEASATDLRGAGSALVPPDFAHLEREERRERRKPRPIVLAETVAPVKIAGINDTDVPPQEQAPRTPFDPHSPAALADRALVRPPDATAAKPESEAAEARSSEPDRREPDDLTPLPPEVLAELQQSAPPDFAEEPSVPMARPEGADWSVRHTKFQGQRYQIPRREGKPDREATPLPFDVVMGDPQPPEEQTEAASDIPEMAEARRAKPIRDPLAETPVPHQARGGERARPTGESSGGLHLGPTPGTPDPEHPRPAIVLDEDRRRAEQPPAAVMSVPAAAGGDESTAPEARSENEPVGEAGPADPLADTGTDEDNKAVQPEEKTGGILFARSDPAETEAWWRHYSKDRRPRYLDEDRYSLILAPARPIRLKATISVLRRHLGLSLHGALHSLKRHHGILATDMACDEAVEMARRLARKGQDVMLVEHDDRLAFGEPIDVFKLSMDEKQGRFSTADRVARRRFSQLVGISCGRIAFAEQEEGKAVLDLYFAPRGQHLRLWRNTLAPVPLPGESEPDEAVAFHALARRLARRAPQAIQSRSFSRWIENAELEPPVRFTNLIEYDHYSEWYLMAHFARVKTFRGERKPD